MTCGIDWARDDHAVSVVDARGREINRCTVEHSAAGLRELVAVLARAGVGEVAIERPDGPVVDALLAARDHRGGDQPEPGQEPARPLRLGREQRRPVRRVRPGRHAAHRPGPAAAADARQPGDRRAAPRLPGPQGPRQPTGSPWPTSCAPTCATPSPARSGCSPRSTRRSAWRSWPASTPRTAPTGSRPGGSPPGWPASATPAAPTPPSCTPAWPPRPAAPPATTAPRKPAITRALLAVLITLAEQIKALSEQIGEQLALHADAHIFTSLPRSGTVRAARLLAEIGDCRARFPTPESLACLAGAAPSTRQSGKIRAVSFRWACDKQLRDAVTDFAGDSRRASPWAADLYNRARARGHDHPHAVRILARAWLFIIWHCWQDQRRLRPRPAPRPPDASSSKINNAAA